jgi:hypothetical protein
MSLLNFQEARFLDDILYCHYRVESSRVELPIVLSFGGIEPLCFQAGTVVLGMWLGGIVPIIAGPEPSSRGLSYSVNGGSLDDDMAPVESNCP